jgi:hypothetical protein
MPGRKLQAVPKVPSPAQMSRKRAAFIRVAEPRLNNAINDLKVLARSADRVRYEIYDSDVDYIEEQLKAAVERVLGGFRKGNAKPALQFPNP